MCIHGSFSFVALSTRVGQTESHRLTAGPLPGPSTMHTRGPAHSSALALHLVLGHCRILRQAASRPHAMHRILSPDAAARTCCPFSAAFLLWSNMFFSLVLALAPLHASILSSSSFVHATVFKSLLLSSLVLGILVWFSSSSPTACSVPLGSSSPCCPSYSLLSTPYP